MNNDRIDRIYHIPIDQITIMSYGYIYNGLSMYIYILYPYIMVCTIYIIAIIYPYITLHGITILISLPETARNRVTAQPL